MSRYAYGIIFHIKEKRIRKMKRILKTTIVLIAALVLGGLLAAEAHAEEITEQDYLITQSGSEYVLSSVRDGTPSETLRSESLSYILSSVSDGNITFDNLSVSERVTLSSEGTVTLSGALSFTDGFGMTLDGGNIVFSSLDLSFEGGFLRNKSGTLTLASGAISSRGTAVVQDYDNSASFIMRGGTISASASPAVSVLRGTASILGGHITSDGEYAVENRATLNLGGASFSSAFTALYTEHPVRLFSELSSEITVSYGGEFKDGTMTELLLGADAADCERVRIFDKNGKEYSLRYFESSPFSEELHFGAVYLPLTVTFKSGDTVISEKETVSGVCVEPPDYAPEAGFEFAGWFSDAALTSQYRFDEPVCSDLTLFASVALTAPEYRISSGSATFDGRIHYFSLDFVDHPLLEEASLVYEWYRNGELVASGERLALTNACDTGEYSCKISLYYGRYSVSVTTPSAAFTIKKATVTLPTVGAKTYTSRHLTPDIPESALYTFTCSGGTDAGVYPVTFSLKDSENYRWDVGDAKDAAAQFEILRAENEFLSEFAVFDIYFLAENTFSVLSRFGEVRFAYYLKGTHVPLAGLPSEIGEYTVVASVEGTSNYTPLTTEPLEFSILREEVLGISLAEPPSRTEYTAFESFSPAGLLVTVSYSSGRSERIGADKLSVRYQSGTSLRAGDNAVLVSYGGMSASVPVTVRCAEYDMSGVVFSDTSVEYCGAYIVPSIPQGLPVGLDGIPLRASVVGGGINVGTYALTLVFSTDSPNYNTPAPLTATLNVTKKAVTLTWSGNTFVYNGKKQAPTAFFTDLSGKRASVTVLGGEYDAGEGYIAAAEDNGNYEFLNPTVTFSIEKADFDLSGLVWSEKSFVYDSEEHSVTLSGLPEGLKITGYANNTATVAGSYSALVGFSFDERNYNAPKIEPYEWSVTLANYDTSVLVFENTEVVYDGNEHFPLPPSEMPVGLDGIALEYAFSRGAVHVLDGTVEVTVNFFTESANYIPPEPIVRTVKILPKPIRVIWQELSFTYDGGYHLPTASASECSVRVEGGAALAGEHTAFAISENPDFRVENSVALFVIEKAENRFTEEPFARDVFEGRELALGGAALFGETVFVFFADEALEREIDRPTAPGRYFAVATVPESDNYFALSSSPLEFTIIKVVAVGLSVDITRDNLKAFERLAPGDFTAYLTFNDGSVDLLNCDEVSVSYKNGGSLRRADTEVCFSYGDFDCSVAVTVGRADYDTSGVVWTGLIHTYDGTGKHAEPKGLPTGVTLISVEGTGAVSAGSYTLRANVSYDEENYNPPLIPEAEMVIKKAVLDYPSLSPAVYNGIAHTPSSNSALWTVTLSAEAKNSGEYTALLIITDADNYVFENGESTAETTFTVLPRELSVSVNDVTVYLFEEYRDPGAVITAGLVPGDTVDFFYTVENDVISVETSNGNYRLNVTEGRLIRSSLPSPRVRTIIMLVLLLVILLVLLFVIIARKRNSIILLVKGSAFKRKMAKSALAKPALSEEKRHEESEDNLGKEVNAPHLESFIDPIDTDRADALISNSFAKELVSSEGESVYTSGWRKSVVNIDTLSENFTAGERVDVNILKSMSLIPYDTAYIKVLARGMIDKPLYVYANDFSNTAIKMLALTGGKAVKVTTVKLKDKTTVSESDIKAPDEP